MIRLAQFASAISPLIFAALTIALMMLSIDGLTQGQIAFGTGRTVVYFSREGSPTLYYVVLAIYLTLIPVGIWLTIRSWRWWRSNGSPRQ